MLNSILLQIVTSPAGDSASKATAAVTNAMPTVAPAQDGLWLLDLLMKGGPMMIPIGILFLMAIYFFFERFLTISRTGKADENFFNNLKDSLSSRAREKTK